tara:strand:- start:376 stop:618 length:243 start_codon:yes stop_codon:yes gene_type:complete
LSDRTELFRVDTGAESEEDEEDQEPEAKDGGLCRRTGTPSDSINTRIVGVSFVTISGLTNSPTIDDFRSRGRILSSRIGL